MYRHGDAFWHGGHGFPVLGWLVPLLLLALVVGLVAWALLRARDGRHVPVAATPAPSVDVALAELRLRYARGELPREDFLRISTDLGAPPPPPGPSGSA